jgi:hypothetical protein
MAQISRFQAAWGVCSRASRVRRRRGAERLDERPGAAEDHPVQVEEPSDEAVLGAALARERG